ncbi:17234_t:CDS:2 [Funneliformis caledonium]|uniref:17234_t:CDS:1 n=1 Tax=Funneliformis caledonium TaxID=1117310 RepID=A0A9N9A1L7_9GLOM|nr:17234_t:CDS:2 [Funneliformis caledonium]
MSANQSTQTVVNLPLNEETIQSRHDAIKSHLPRVSIEYCVQCRWMAQELLITFNDLLGEVALIPGSKAIFKVHINGELIWDRKQEGRFPEMKELKTLIRNIIAPDMNLGHSDADKKGESAKTTATNDDISVNKTTGGCKDCT